MRKEYYTKYLFFLYNNLYVNAYNNNNNNKEIDTVKI